MALEDLSFKISANFDDAPQALQSLGKVESGVKDVSRVATTARIDIAGLERSVMGLAFTARPLGVLNGQVGVTAQLLHGAAIGAHHLAVAVGFIGSMLRTMQVGLMIVLSPLTLVIGMVRLLAKGLMVVLSPVIAVATAIFRFKLFLSGLHLQLVLFSKFLSMLPPRLRVLVVGLVAVGAAGRAGAAAVSLAVGAFRGLRTAVSVATLPLLAITRPMEAAKVSSKLLAGGMVQVAVAARRATVATTHLTVAIASKAVAGMRSLASSTLSAAKNIGVSLVGAAKAGAVGLALLAVAAVAWGAKTATAAETSRVVFGTMLKDMEQGQALMQAMQNSKVAALFDPKAIQDAGRDLFKAGVPVTQIIGKMEQLGQIAVATKTPIEDLSRIYRQGMAKGAFQTDLVNQMAERGIDIYHALEHVTGLTGLALSDAMSKGKIGAVQMNAAIEHLTTGTGIYAGAVENVSQTTAGMMSQITNNVTQALGNMMAVGTNGPSKLLVAIVAMTAGWKTSFASLAPVVTQVIGVVTDVFMGLFSFAKMVFAGIFGAGQANFGGLLEVGMQWATSFRWFFQNFGDISRFAFAQFALFGVTAFNDFIYFFTDKVPAYLKWFSENWKQVFVDAGNLIVTVFSNIAKNIGTAMRAIWDYIKSGGTAELKFAFVPLLDGFKATVSDLPNIPDRAMTALEKNLTGQVESLGTSLANNFDAMQADATASLNAIAPAEEKLRDQASGKSLGETTATETASKKAVENKATLTRSSEGQNLFAQFVNGMKSDEKAKQAQQAQIDAAKELAVMRREMERGKPIVGRRLAKA